MNITDIFIKRPVLATVVSLLILIFGLRAIYDLALRQFPKMDNTVITITTSYSGASAQLIKGFISTPIEKVIAGADGIDYVTGQSTQGASVVKAHIMLNYDPNKAFTSIMSKVAQVKNQLPKNALDPVITKSTGSQMALMYLAFNSTQLSPEQITDYITRVVQPKLETISGVAQAQILGDKIFAMRIWLNLQKMAAFDVTATDISNVLLAKNFQAAAGKTKGEFVAYDITASTELHTVEAFKNIVIKSNKNSLVRLGDLARVELGSQNYDSSVTFNGKQAIFIGISTTPTANPLSVITNVRKLLPNLKMNYPPGLKSTVVYDATDYIRASINEVIRTIAEASIIVILVIYLFLGSFRAVMIPIVTIPLSLIGVCSLMLMLGYSINLLTLLAMVLAIGLVVDDAIIVVENIHRHIEEEGMTPYDAAIKGAGELATPIITMTITLAAVYAPIGFMGGLTGGLFKEFAFTLASAVIISGVIALTLSPMMCSKLLTSDMRGNKFVNTLDKWFETLKNRYQQSLAGTLKYRAVVVVFAITVLISCGFLYVFTQKQLAPVEDQSVLFISATAPEYANLDYTQTFTAEFGKIFKAMPAIQDYFVVNGMGAVNSVISGVILKPWNQRKLSQQKLNPIVQKKLNSIAGLKSVAFALPSLPTGDDGLPVQFVITTTGNYQLLYSLADEITQAAKKSGLFIYIDNSLKFNRPEIKLKINRSKAADLGIDIQDIGTTLSTALSGNYTNYFSMSGRSYEVIPQIMRRFRNDPNQLNYTYVRTAKGGAVALSTIVSIEHLVQPNSLTQFNQLNSATIQGIPVPGRTIADALHWLQTKADTVLPKGVSYNYAGQSRTFMSEGNALLYTFFFAFIIIFLVLAAQFESFRDPLIILISVPMSICGALIFLNLGLATINIYTQVGMITLIGLISKHGILIVDFANKLRLHENLNIHDAIIKAASIRLRPILMTTAAMVLGVSPLLIATGAGAVSRFDIGLVIATGMLLGTLFTLFVVPTMYTFFAERDKVIGEVG